LVRFEIAARSNSATADLSKRTKQRVDAGGLVNYGVDLNDCIDVPAFYIDRIVEGTKLADLMVEQASRYFGFQPEDYESTGASPL